MKLTTPFLSREIGAGVVKAAPGGLLNRAADKLTQKPGCGCAKRQAAMNAVVPGWTFGTGVVGITYTETFVALGSPAPTYTQPSGTLPTGVTLSGNILSGTPTVAGVYTFTLRATNTWGTADQSFTITVYAASGGSSNSGFVG